MLKSNKFYNVINFLGMDGATIKTCTHSAWPELFLKCE